MKALYPSQFMLNAAKMKPAGAVNAEHDTGCILCGMPILKGDLCTHHKDTPYDGSSFVDRPSAANKFNEFICSCCLPLWTKDFLQTYSKSLVTEDGVFKLASNEDWASLLISPPKKPFMAFISNAQQQHLIWRTPVNYSPERFTIRIGSNRMTIRHKLLMRAVQAQKQLLEMYREWYKKNKSGKPSAMLTIFVGGDREQKSTGFVTNPSVLLAAEEMNGKKEIEIINNLSQAERWAVAVIGWSKLEKAVPFTKRLPI